MKPRSETAPPTGEGFVLLKGLRDTRGAIESWRQEPGSVLGPWFAGAFAVAVGLLTAVWVVSLFTTADPTPLFFPGSDAPPNLGDVGTILGLNLLVLALHATACVAGFMAGSSMRLVAQTKSGLSRAVHERAGQVAIVWVVAVTVFSLVTQAYALGMTASTISAQLGIGTWLLVVTVLPHALIELTAVFLPLAAWMIASRRDEWDELLAATIVTVAVALPMLLISVSIELTLWPVLLELSSPVR